LNFLIPTFLIFSSEHLLNGVEDDGSVREEEGAAGGDFIEHEEFLFGTDFAVISLCSFFEVFLVFG